jgi:aspartyl-tRNA(Asn)/glutamyl-tRNA(Gln) amidotransferase subunit A
MTRTVEDAAVLLSVIAGYDPLDPTTVDVPVSDYTSAIGAPTRTLRVGVPGGAFFEDLHPDVMRAFDEALDVLRSLVARVGDVTLPPAPNPATVWGPEIYAYHARWIVESPEKYQPPTRRAIQRSAELRAGEYAQARRDVDLARVAIRPVFDDVDILATPTMKGPAPPIDGGGGGLNTSQFNVYGLPTISVPCGFSSEGLPIGLQLSGAHFAESTVLALAHAYEQATEWGRRRPDLGEL